LGQIERDRGELDGALAKYEEAARLASETGEATLLAHTVRHLGDILRKMARTAEAEKRYDEALGIYRAQPDTTPLDLANAFRGMAVLKDEIGERGIARALWEEASRLYALAGVDAGVAECRKRIEEIEI
jgi:tetratricopeptide (TPR) repeat protein